MELVVRAEDGRSSRADSTAYFTAKTSRTQRGTARKRRPPGIGCLRRNQPTTQGLSRTHINNSHNHTTTAPLNIHHPNHPQAPKQEDFADQPYHGVIHMITGGSSADFYTKRQKRDHYRSINHVAVIGPVV
jgi:hypothetical protein